MFDSNKKHDRPNNMAWINGIKMTTMYGGLTDAIMMTDHTSKTRMVEISLIFKMSISETVKTYECA